MTLSEYKGIFYSNIVEIIEKIPTMDTTVQVTKYCPSYPNDLCKSMLSTNVDAYALTALFDFVSSKYPEFDSYLKENIAKNTEELSKTVNDALELQLKVYKKAKNKDE